MTKDELCKVLELFAISAIKTSRCYDLTIEEQHSIIVETIEDIADTVMICTRRDATRPVYN